MENTELQLIFSFGRLTPAQRAIVELIFQEANKFATFINNTIPDCREKSLAITHIQQAMLIADAAVGIRMKENAEDHG